jgi:peroxin-13
MPSPPKPWEASGPQTVSNSDVSTSAMAAAPAIPTRTNTAGLYNSASSKFLKLHLTLYNRHCLPTECTGLNSYGGMYNRYGSYGSGYGGYGSYNSYSPYNRFGSYSTPYNRLDYGYGGGGPEDFTVGQRMEAGTRATFELIEQIVGAFGGFAQMLDATFMATHASFMAMVGVAEQFGHVHTYFGNIFNIYNLIRWIKRSANKLAGRPDPVEPSDQQQLAAAQQSQMATDDSTPPPPPERPPREKLSKTPFIIFLTAVIGLPYLMNKLMKSMSASKAVQIEMPDRPPVAVATFDFIPGSPMELRLTKGATVEVLDTLDPLTREPSSWWQGRLRDGSIGVFPANHVQYINHTAQPGVPVTISVDDFDKHF